MTWAKRLGQKYSLGTRFFAAILLIQAGLLGLLALNGGRLIHNAIESQIEHRIEDIGRLLSPALAVPMAQRDLARVRDEVDEIAEGDDLVHLIVQDRNGLEVARFNRRKAGQPVIEGRADILLAGRVYGRMSYGLPAQEIAVAHKQLLLQSGLLALLAIAVSALFLWLAVEWLGCRLTTLREASGRIAAGDYQMRVPLQGETEIDALAHAFNRMAEAVQDQVQRFSAIADYTYDVEFWLSPEGKLLWINPSVQRVFGYSAEACLAMQAFPLVLVHKTEREAARARLEEALCGGRDGGYIFRTQHQNGNQFWAVANWLPIHNAQGENVGLRASIHNIDALKETEEKLRQAVLDLRLSESLQARYLDNSEQERARLVALLAAMNLGILFVAEYVENHKVLDMLNQLGVDMVQGYLLDIPEPLPRSAI